MHENLLPVGSVVLLHGDNKRLMVTGYFATMRGGTEIYDYTGCLYPEGIVNADAISFFNQGDIERLYFIGFQDGEGLQHLGRLADLGELYVTEDGKIAERESPGEEGEGVADEESAPADSELVAGDEGDVEPPVFAEV